MLALFLYANMAVKEACGDEKEACLCEKSGKNEIFILTKTNECSIINTSRVY